MVVVACSPPDSRPAGTSENCGANALLRAMPSHRRQPRFSVPVRSSDGTPRLEDPGVLAAEPLGFGTAKIARYQPAISNSGISHYPGDFVIKTENIQSAAILRFGHDFMRI
jgi:hypothetical protein